MLTIREQAQRARGAARALAALGASEKNRGLRAIAAALRANVESIGVANRLDIDAAREAGVNAAMVDRLDMGSKTIEATAAGVEFIAGLPDPVGSRGPMQRLENGLLVGKQRLPLGVIAVVYESRPNVTVDAFALCMKAGNAVLLRGGKEAKHTNEALGRVLGEALAGADLPADAVQIIPATDRQGIKELLALTDLVDLAIPRGGEGLIRFVAENARVPVVKHYKGVCHLFVDAGSNHRMALELTINGKTQRPGVCNALECLLVHEREAAEFLPRLADALAPHAVELRACPRSLPFLPGAKPASESDWGAEFLAKVLAVHAVSDIDAALEHVTRYGSNHTEAICTESQPNAERWLREVDASCVLVNASTRFNDGGELGLGAEIGISTSKLHAYGPMGIESLTAEKWIVIGEGQVRS